MGRLPENALARLRSPGRALNDLVERYQGLAVNDPDRDEIGRMIRQLAVEITRSLRQRSSPR
jgi:hypothetical protein